MSLELLKEFLETQWNIIVDLNISKTNLLRLKEDKYLHEEKIKSHGFFQHHWYQLKFISIIQLVKLFGCTKNDKISFHKFCSIIESDPFNKEMKYQLFLDANRKNRNLNSRKQLIQLSGSVRRLIAEKQDLIDKVIDARDKIYAHFDPNGIVEAVKSDELKILIELANEIHILWTSTLFNETNLQHMDGWDIDYLLRKMSSMRKIELEDLEMAISVRPITSAPGNGG